MGYILVTYLNGISLAELKEEESTIQISINNLLLLNNESNYSEIDELLPYLPNHFNEAQIYNELELVKDLANINDPPAYTIDFDNDSNSPFDIDVCTAPYAQLSNIKKASRIEMKCRHAVIT